MEPVIEIKHIFKNYYHSNDVVQYVLKDINCSIYKGDFVAIMGPSGSGKSTFMNILGCLDRATSGDYILSNINVSTMNQNQLADIRNRQIGFVFQGFNLLSKRTIFDNVSMPMIYKNSSYSERRRQVEAMLDRVGLKKYIDNYPTELSGGMQQRVAIARALINNPAVVLADEPTGNLDTKTSVEIMDIFNQLNQQLNITIVMVTHEPDIARFSKRLLYIKDGVKQQDISIEEAIKQGLV